MSKCKDAFPGYGGDSVRDVVGGMGRLGKVDSILSSVQQYLIGPHKSTHAQAGLSLWPKSLVAVGDFWSSDSMEACLASSACDEHFSAREKDLWWF